MAGRGFLIRENHRVLLTIHALVMIFGLVACAVLNRRFSPERFWVQWVALAWGAAFLAHLWVFSRGTLATMGRAGPARATREPKDGRKSPLAPLRQSRPGERRN